MPMCCAIVFEGDFNGNCVGTRSIRRGTVHLGRLEFVLWRVNFSCGVPCLVTKRTLVFATYCVRSKLCCKLSPGRHKVRLAF